MVNLVNNLIQEQEGCCPVTGGNAFEDLLLEFHESRQAMVLLLDAKIVGVRKFSELH